LCGVQNLDTKLFSYLATAANKKSEFFLLFPEFLAGRVGWITGCTTFTKLINSILNKLTFVT
jgi:hypothetical protein